MFIVRRKCHTAAAAADATLIMSFENRQKTRLRMTLPSGEDIGLVLDRGTSLHPGDLLSADDGRVVMIIAAEEALLEVRSNDALALVRAAYHLGNRHVPVEIAPGRLRFPADAILARMLRGLGFAVTEVRAAFEPEPGAYGAASPAHAGRTHHHGVIHSVGSGDSHRGVIHDFADFDEHR